MLGEAGNVLVLLLDIEAVGGDELDLDFVGLAGLVVELAVAVDVADLGILDDDVVDALGETAAHGEAIDLIDWVAVLVFLVPVVVVLTRAARDGDGDRAVVDTVASGVLLGEGDRHGLDEGDLSRDVAGASLGHLEADGAVDGGLRGTGIAVEGECRAVLGSRGLVGLEVGA